ncbi:hypothetical protein [Paenibacillus pectinilyticus]|uniref:hypothetical protein n=1 Tax=Paenibacillus pectinilyticus TaxID=512399 RepID=UPI001428D32C|nr:hypothetical protein [Paenibacillus pectinilyticus]
MVDYCHATPHRALRAARGSGKASEGTRGRLGALAAEGSGTIRSNTADEGLG